MRTLLWLATLVAVAAAGAAAQSPSSALTLEACIRLAQSAQSAVSVARHETEIAQNGITQARAGFLPQAQFSNGYTYNSPLANTAGAFSFVALNGVHEYSSQLGAAMEIDTSGKLRAEMARARADQSAASANLGLAQRDLKRAVTAGYFRLLLARHLSDAVRASLDEARSFEKRVRLLAEHGEAARADVVKAAAETNFLEQALNAAELEAQLANFDLASFWTSAVNEPLTIEDLFLKPPAPPEDQAAATLYLRRLEFNLLDAQKQGFQADARRARAALLPQAGLVFQYGIDSTHARIADRGYATFLTLDIPIFDWFRARSAARQFDLRARQVEATHAMDERVFSRDYQNALARVKLIYQQISITQSQVKSSEENLLLSRARYEGGEGPALDVVNAQGKVTQARTNYYTALANYLNAKADLEVAKGQ